MSALTNRPGSGRSAGAERAVVTTVAPELLRRSAIASPMPLAPPVTRARLPLNSVAGESLIVSSLSQSDERNHRVTRRSSPRESTSDAPTSGTVKPSFHENTRGRRVVVQSCRADFRGAEGARGKLDQQRRQLGTEALTPERGKDRVSNGSYPAPLGMPPDAAQPDKMAISVERGTEAMVATGRRRCLAKLARRLDRDRPLDPEKGSRDLGARVQRLHEGGVTSIEPTKIEPLRSQRHRWSHSLSASQLHCRRATRLVAVLRARRVGWYRRRHQQA